MDILDEGKLQKMAENVVDHAQKAIALECEELLSKLDGWTATMTITLKRPVPKP